MAHSVALVDRENEPATPPLRGRRVGRKPMQTETPDPQKLVGVTADERTDLPRRATHPEDGLVYACPDCGEAAPTIRRSDRVEIGDDEPYACYACSSAFDELAVRENTRNEETRPLALSASGQELLGADPDEIDISADGGGSA